jgi:hypothetical protein
MPKERCIEWIGEKCVKWTMGEDDKLTATINYGECPVDVKKKIENDIGKNKGFRFKIRD